MKRLCVFLVLLGMILNVAGCFVSTAEGKAAEALKSKDPEVRKDAARQLTEIATPNALRLLELAADDPDFRVREVVRKAVAEIRKRTFMK
jgi:hypothetical protein